MSCDPSDVAALARCFSSCIPDQLAVRSYLLSQYVPCVPLGGGARVTGCKAPSSPTGATSGTVTSTSIAISWTQPASPVAITGFAVFWGTNSGSANLGQAFIPAAVAPGVGPFPASYTITGLPSSTTVFFTIFTISGLCQSTGSTGNSGTTSASICSAGTTFANSWAAQVVANGGAMPSQNTINTVATLQCGLITDGLDPLLPAWNLLVPDSLIATASPQKVGEDLTQLWNFQNFVGGDVTVNGVQGNGTTKFVNPGQMIIPANHSAQNIGICVYVSVAASTVNGRSCGNIQSVSATPGILIGAHDNTANSFGLNGANPGNLITTPTHGAGFYADQRVSNVDHRLFFASAASPMAQIGATDAVAYNGGFSDSGSFWFAINQGGSVLLNSAETQSAQIVTLGLSLAQLTNLFARFDTARRSLGGGFV
jgi:hypothetical protein